ncbi:MAG: acyltransferase domain-containing protein, partial [Planctomycetales bacterium]|nr:acyltransferase domain-containing protein [Planctomycetales bacterium]
MQNFKILALTPAGVCEPAIAIAACRAGAIGVLDAEFVLDTGDVFAAIDRVQRYTSGSFGVRLDGRQDELLERLLDRVPNGLDWLILSGGGDLGARIRQVRSRGLAACVEAIDVAEGIAAASAGADAVCLKGNESGGRVGHDTAFVLLQRWQQACQSAEATVRDFFSDLPFFVQGGIGLHTAAACAAGGAAGVVLDAQLLLTRESSVSPQLRQWLQAADGSESRILSSDAGAMFRVYHRPGCALAQRLTRRKQDENTAPSPSQMFDSDYRDAVCHGREAGFLVAGQDIALARPLADRYVTVGGIVSAIAQQVEHNLAAAARLLPLAESSPLAASHRTRYPILQGPMTRVSDTAAFADAVARGGALPFLALALLRGPETEALLQETQQMLGDRTWGVGILGFLPAAIRKEQTAAVLKYRPPMALIAGGRPDQARELEEAGIPTYLHVPSPGLLKMFLKDGARRFIFEGRECGGHVGPRSSFALWEMMCQLLLEHTKNAPDGDPSLHVVFAGGIHDGLSASMVAAMAAELAEHDVHVGVLMGTAYLFTQEAVDAGAIVPRFQQEALQCRDTVLLETGPGHAIRCVKTPYYDVFESEKNRLEQAGRSHEEIVRELEGMNIGRLRVASKGVDRMSPTDRSLRQLPEDEQYQRGMYMIGQVAGMRSDVTTISQLHDEVCRGGSERLVALAAHAEPQPLARPSDIAIIGMSCYYPGALDVDSYWSNILRKHYAVCEIPENYWDWRLFYDPDPRAKDKIISKWGGFLSDITFDPLRYGITPKSMESIEPLQLMVLEAVRHALDDAGYGQRPFNRERTAAIVGIGGGGGPMSVAYGFRTCMPLLDYIEGMPIKSDEIIRRAAEVLPEWTEDSFPGFLSNVAVGRVANRFNFGGPNYAIDAACASSLASLDACVRELEMGTSDFAVALGADSVQTPFAYMAFSKTHALSAKGRCRPFDAEADGIVLSEGVGVVVLKRLADAERDGDRIYAVIKGVGSSSDGKEKGLTAPNSSGQLRALRRAYAKAGIPASRVGLIEAHGTGTVVGDRTEATSLSDVMRESGGVTQSCALGSVKSMIGHSKCAAGVAGLIKTSLALHYKVLPPTLVESPNPTARFEETALYLNSEARPWVHGGPLPRCAGVSAFGFGGTNFHTVLEEYRGNYLDPPRAAINHWPSEVFVWRCESRESLLAATRDTLKMIEAVPQLPPAEVAAALWNNAGSDPSQPVLAIVASHVNELRDKLTIALRSLTGEAQQLADPRGICFALKPQEHAGKVAMLFPGQGSQYPNMAAEIAMCFPETREVLDDAETLLHDDLERPLNHYLYPPSSFNEEQRAQCNQELARTEVAQPAIGAVSLAMLRLLRELNVAADMVAGHSFGEYTALAAAGAIGEDELVRAAYHRGACIRAVAGRDHGGMVAIDADREKVAQVLANVADATIANCNSPQQTVVSAPVDVLETVVQTCEANNLRAKRVPVSCGFHSPLVAPAAEPLNRYLQHIDFQPTDVPVYANTTAKPYPSDPQAIRQLLAEHLVSPVLFSSQIEQMYEDGARVFIEVGPQSVLTSLTRAILGDRSYVAAAMDLKDRSGITQLHQLVAQLLMHGVAVNLNRLYQVRNIRAKAMQAILQDATPAEPAKTIWMVNGIRNRKIGSPEPRLLGQPPTDSAAKHDRDVAASGTKADQPARSEQPPAAQSSASKSQSKSPAITNHQQVSNQPMKHPAINQVTPAAVPMTPRQPIQPAAAAEGHLPMAAPVGDGECERVMQGFQQVMAKFLDTQRAVMLSYLQGVVPDDGQYSNTPLELPPIGGYPPPHPAHLPQVSSNVAAPGPAPETTPVPPAYAAAESVRGNGHAAGSNGEGRSEGRHAIMPQPASEAAGESVRSNGHALSAPTQASSPAVLSRDLLSDKLMELVSERTGYPTEMLDVDLDLEADLGIDSIKRVEILGSLAEIIGQADSMQSNDDSSSSLDLEKLSSLRTLRKILDYLEQSLAADDRGPDSTNDEHAKPAAADGMPASPSGRVSGNGSGNGHPHERGVLPRNAAATNANSNGHAPDAIQRGLVTIAESPLPKGGGFLIPSGAVILTDDGRGVATELASRLADYGQEVFLVRDCQVLGSGREDANVALVDLSDPEAVKRCVGEIKERCGTVAGLIHLQPLARYRPADGSPSAGLARRAHRDMRSLYLLARELESSICDAGNNGGGLLLAVTGLGGRLGYGSEPVRELADCGHGAILGFVKCVGMEWDHVLVRAIDVDPEGPVEDIAYQVQSELSDANGPLEVGYNQGRRVTWEPVAAPLADRQLHQLPFDEDSTVLITGGARGITASIAEELGRRCQLRLVLVGRSPQPESEESADTCDLVETSEIKGAIIRSLQSAGNSAAPAEVENCYRRLMVD